MQVQEPPPLKNHVLTRGRNGRCYYDPQVKQALVLYAVQSGASLPDLAVRQGVSLGLLRRWVREYEEQNQLSKPEAPPSLPAFVAATVTNTPVLPSSAQLSIKLPNGIAIDFTHADAASLSSLLELLYKLPCSVSIAA